MHTNNPPHGDISNYRFLSMKEVCGLTGYSRTHIYRMERAGTFPRRRKLGLGKIGFLFREFVEWQNNLPTPDLPPEDDE